MMGTQIKNEDAQQSGLDVNVLKQKMTENKKFMNEYEKLYCRLMEINADFLHTGFNFLFEEDDLKFYEIVDIDKYDDYDEYIDRYIREMRYLVDEQEEYIEKEEEEYEKALEEEQRYMEAYFERKRKKEEEEEKAMEAYFERISKKEYEKYD